MEGRNRKHRQMREEDKEAASHCPVKAPLHYALSAIGNEIPTCYIDKAI